jgi:hypothetical protein
MAIAKLCDSNVQCRIPQVDFFICRQMYYFCLLLLSLSCQRCYRCTCSWPVACLFHLCAHAVFVVGGIVTMQSKVIGLLTFLLSPSEPLITTMTKSKQSLSPCIEAPCSNPSCSSGARVFHNLQKHISQKPECMDYLQAYRQEQLLKYTQLKHKIQHITGVFAPNVCQFIQPASEQPIDNDVVIDGISQWTMCVFTLMSLQMLAFLTLLLWMILNK